MSIHAAQDGKCTSGALRTGDWILVDPTFEKSARTCSAQPEVNIFIDFPFAWMTGGTFSELRLMSLGESNLWE